MLARVVLPLQDGAAQPSNRCDPHRDEVEILEGMRFLSPTLGPTLAVTMAWNRPSQKSQHWPPPPQVLLALLARRTPLKHTATAQEGHAALVTLIQGLG